MCIRDSLTTVQLPGFWLQSSADWVSCMYIFDGENFSIHNKLQVKQLLLFCVPLDKAVLAINSSTHSMLPVILTANYQFLHSFWVVDEETAVMLFAFWQRFTGYRFLHSLWLVNEAMAVILFASWQRFTSWFLHSIWIAREASAVTLFASW